MIFRGRHYKTGQVWDVRVEHGIMVACGPSTNGSPADYGDATTWLAPGMVDVQVNGFAGGDFCGSDLTVDEVKEISRAVLATGVTRYLPTVVTNAQATMEHQLRTLASACDQDEVTGRMAIGFHVEGPHLCPEDGPRGAHPKEHVRPPSLDEFERLSEAAAGRVRMVTVAPEVEGAIDFIESLSERGIVMAIGHHQANRAALDAAIAAGVKVCTHLGNGSHAQMHRLDNYIWEQLSEDRLWASFIPDGHHVPPPALRCMLRAKGLERSLLVTDATRCAGLAPGNYDFVGREVTLHPDGRLCLKGTPYFAGAALKMPDGIGVVTKHAGYAMSEVLDLVVDRPLRLLGDPLAEKRLAVGQPADLVIFNWNETKAQMSVVVTVLGEQLCEASA